MLNKNFFSYLIVLLFSYINSQSLNSCSNLGANTPPSKLSDCYTFGNSTYNCCYVNFVYQGMNISSCAISPAEKTVNQLAGEMYSVYQVPSTIQCSANYTTPTPSINSCSNLGNSIQPRQSSDCTTFNNATHNCCFYSMYATSSSLSGAAIFGFNECLAYPVTSDQTKLITYSKTINPTANYTYQCNSTPVIGPAIPPFFWNNQCSNLGTTSPTQQADCNSGASNLAPGVACCYVSYNGKSACQVFATGAATQNLVNTIQNNFGFTPNIQCSASNIYVFYMVLVALALILL